MEEMDTIIKRCCAIIREKIKEERAFYGKLVSILDKVVAQDLSINKLDIQQSQGDRRKDLWEFMFKEDINKYLKLLKILNDFKKDDDDVAA